MVRRRWEEVAVGQGLSLEAVDAFVVVDRSKREDPPGYGNGHRSGSEGQGRQPPDHGPGGAQHGHGTRTRAGSGLGQRRRGPPIPGPEQQGCPSKTALSLGA